MVYDDPNVGGVANQFRLMNRHSATMAQLGLDGLSEQQQHFSGQLPLMPGERFQQVQRHQQQQLPANHNKPAFNTMMIQANQRPLSLQVDDRFQNRTNGRAVGQVLPNSAKLLDDRQYLNDKFPASRQQQQQQQRQTDLDQLDDNMYNVLDDDDEEDDDVDLPAGRALQNSDSINGTRANGNDLDGYVNNHHHRHPNHSNGTPETSDSSSQRTGEMNSGNR